LLLAVVALQPVQRLARLEVPDREVLPRRLLVVMALLVKAITVALAAQLHSQTILMVAAVELPLLA
jgi:hypothetical protein